MSKTHVCRTVNLPTFSPPGGVGHVNSDLCVCAGGVTAESITIGRRSWLLRGCASLIEPWWRTVSRPLCRHITQGVGLKAQRGRRGGGISTILVSISSPTSNIKVPIAVIHHSTKICKLNQSKRKMVKEMKEMQRWWRPRFKVSAKF